MVLSLLDDCVGLVGICFLFQGKGKAKFFPPLHCVVHSIGKLVSNADVF